MSRRNTLVRTMHDVGLAAWFGGSLMGAVGVNGATRDMSVREERVPIASDAWGRWSPVALAAIGSHLVGGLGLLLANRGRVKHQKGVGAATTAKTVLTGVALGATAYSWTQGVKLAEAGSVSAASGTVPSGETPPDVVSAQQQLRALQWAIPASTGAIVALASLQGEQQRADQVPGGIAGRMARRADRAARGAAGKAGDKVSALH